jgi:hypothetical protein
MMNQNASKRAVYCAGKQHGYPCRLLLATICSYVCYNIKCRRAEWPSLPYINNKFNVNLKGSDGGA